jgi:hypothetical protein
MSKNLDQIFGTNPVTTIDDLALVYLMLSPYTPGTDAAILGSNLKALFLQAANNLSDVENASTSRVNIGAVANYSVAGNPNGIQAGQFGDFATDTSASDALYLCTATGSASTAVWLAQGGGGSSGPFSSGAGAGSAEGGSDASATALGSDSFAFGNAGTGTGSSATNAFSMGNGCASNSPYSFSFGFESVAVGEFSFAFGNEATAGNAYSMALGFHVNTTNVGSVCWNDSTAQGSASDSLPNQWVGAFTNGFQFWGGTFSKKNIFGSDALYNFVINHGIVENGYTIQVVSTGFSFTPLIGTPTTGTATHLTIFNPVSTLATGTILLPTPTVSNRLRFSTTQTITALTVSSAGSDTILAAPTTLVAGSSFEMIYDVATTTWYPY